MVYADYRYYICDFQSAAIQEADFPRFAQRASAYLDYYTQGRAAKNANLEAVKMACCALAEQYQTIDAAQALAQKYLSYAANSGGAEVSSESVGSWSKSYRSGGESAVSASAYAASCKQALADIARQYLSGTGLLYRGGGCGSCQCSRIR